MAAPVPNGGLFGQQQPGGADGGASAMMGGLDPAMAQAYMQMFQYIQQGLRGGADPGAAGMGFPQLPFPGMAPYTPQMQPEAAIAVSVEGMKFQYQLTEDDLEKVFGRYGAVKRIKVEEAGGSASVIFHNFPDAQAAMTDLNGKVLNGLEGTLRISWVTPSMPPPYPGMPFPGWGFPQAPTPWTQTMEGLGGVSQASPETRSGAAAGVGMAGAKDKGVRKYTCRFLIGIENDKEFQVARRLIGPKGANMKKIVKQTEAKLRLRGVGSGYFEGTSQKESPEPLQMCISCTSQEGYRIAVRAVEELIKRTYDEYRGFCKDNNKAIPDLQICLSENQLVFSASSKGANIGAEELAIGNFPVNDPSGKKDPKRNRRSRPKKDGQPATEFERGEPGPNAPSVEDIEKLIDERNEARRACDFAKADRVRDLLHSRGVALMDEPGGRGRGTEVTTWRYWRD
eukprot:gnl/TRDRNA2_/TRDRNA2_194689_c0_seq1.p1 gnl/TRDRNA2_/TRDRNA2_194689_c0~~gnl/TRDRNA2_/TRDRNA2_194689_c0_seq1.p1  ORF type:complete len:454 (+),score=90.15 gnl/TRDRNA2_/TRDRNA2_194689_c0_seq1:97-1458(+)